MNYMWDINNQGGMTFFKVRKMIQEDFDKTLNRKQSEALFVVIMSIYGSKPLGGTDMSIDEIAKSEALKGKKVLQIKPKEFINVCMACEWKGKEYTCPQCQSGRYLIRKEDKDDRPDQDTRIL